MTETAADSPNQGGESLRNQVRSAVIWRSGTQILGQIIAWASTFLVIRMLDPTDYGLFAMTQVVLVLLNMLNGYGLASAIIQKPDVDDRAIRQLFGMLLLLNLGLGAAQFLMAPLAAAYYRQEIVADLLRVQALLYVATPFIAFPYALLARAMDFRKQAQVNLISATAGALAALGGAYAGMGVWTLVLAPLVLFGTRAIGMTWAARSLMWPSFDFRGAGAIAKFGGLMAAGQLFWFVQSQADVFIAGRLFDPHWLGIYTTSLFLTQILVQKFIPALNEVAFSAYSRMQHDAAGATTAFAKSVRLIMVAAMPFYLGLAATAEPLVHVALGAKWLEAAPIVQILALAMPFMTLQILFAPATDARGRPGIGAQVSATGAVLLPAAFLIGVHWGVKGLALTWVAVWPVFLAITAARSLPVIGLSWRDWLAATAPPVTAAAAMGLVVVLIDRALPPLAPLPHLLVLTAAGAAIYGAWLWFFSRETVDDAIRMIRR
ncbi:lipopolysaccharide biosynthesis protein [Sphingomonas sp. BT-65]|uniref:lipopolysaccharide biosynthesis protein n=1 Tax=Sphingomonas sp. BT-65 TaxID=2989821 RepID=UPI002235AF77|nr:lipopolysaccharide biosynthesis protein [Sphingomonas sp. BT-65]MCW4463373.1 lipopolysaccharide biosynthesis protein [Sphingomonas sp. BT-65]